MTTTTYTIYQSDLKSQVDGKITIEVTNELAGIGTVSMEIDEKKLGPLKMNNWVCYDYSNKMIWVFYPDAKNERDTEKYKYPAVDQRNPATFRVSVGYNFLSFPKEAEPAPMIPPNSGTGTGGSD